MRRIGTILRHLFCAAALALLAAGCVHEFPEEPAPAPVTPAEVDFTLRLEFDTALPLHTVVEYASRAAADDHDARYIVEVYRADARSRSFGREACRRIVLTQDDVAQLDREITVTLEEDLYRFIVWADFVDAGSSDDKYYAADRFVEIALCGERHSGCNDFRDAFRGYCEAEIAAGGDASAVVAMQRPLARYNFITTDLDEFITRVAALRAEQAAHDDSTTASETDTRTVDLGDFRVLFRYAGYMPSSFNLFTDKPADSSTGVWFEGALTRLSDTEAELGFDHVFVNGSETSVTVAVEVYDRDGTRVAGTGAIEVPLVRSKLTTVRGEFLSSQASGSVGIDPGFDGEYNYEVK